MLARSMAGFAFALAASLAIASAYAQQGPGDPASASEEGGKHFDEDGDPTFHITEDGTVDWFTYSGYRRYHAECHVCHGPDGLGSSYAPNLVESVGRMTYPEFLEVVASGRVDTGAGKENVMPAFGTNLNVMCYVDDIYIYLRARSEGAPRGRPPKRADKTEATTEAENACLGT
jgi:methanol metabolism-related c-type cytochrome